MRPKKVILCVDFDERELSTTKFMLTTNGYRVLTASTPDEALAIFVDQPNIKLVLVSEYDSLPDAISTRKLISDLKENRPFVPVILLLDPSAPDVQRIAADAMLSKNTCSTEQLLVYVREFTKSTRGPRKGSPGAIRCGMAAKARAMREVAA
jgi:CheY-like chemotaxis protein